jgi:glycosyltransferase involved in cell wall biosynthesis
MNISLALTGNEPRQKYLFDALASLTRTTAVLPFDEIDPFTKWRAAALSFAWPRAAWWENYHMHPLVQARRRKVLNRSLASIGETVDALLMWGSWFQPDYKRGATVRYFNYIDQSHALKNLPGEHSSVLSRRRRSHAMQALTYQASSGIFCMSEWARQQTIESHDIDPHKVITVGWGPCSIDLSNEDLSDTDRMQVPLILHVSNDFQRKGIDYLIQTADQVCSIIPEARFVVIGRDAGSNHVPPSTSRVTFLGRITDRRTLEDYFRKATLFFLPHRFDRSPHVLIEAMSAALPLVTSAQGGAIELIQDTGIGFLCPIGDVDAYANAILSLLRDSSLRKRMGSAARSLMRNNYNWTVIAARMLTSMGGILKK